MGIAAARGVTEAERQTGIPKQTIHEWTKSPEFGRLRTSAREDVIDQFWVALQLALEAVRDGLRDPETPLRDKQQALATLYDRHALMTGEATARSESRDITGTLSDVQLADTIRVIDGGRGGTQEEASRETAG